MLSKNLTLFFAWCLVWTLHKKEVRRKGCEKFHTLNPGYKKESSRVWQKKNRASESEKDREWKKLNPDKVRGYDQKKHAKRRQKPEVRLLSSLRARVRNVLFGFQKSDPTLKLLGCSAAELRQHLEKQWQPGMAWETYGRKGWHIDHKRPCASFDLSDPAQQRECFHYTNLQPLWALENIKKGDAWLKE